MDEDIMNIYDDVVDETMTNDEKIQAIREDPRLEITGLYE